VAQRTGPSNYRALTTLFVGLLGIVVVSVIVWFKLWTILEGVSKKTPQDELLMEVAKGLTQLVLVAVLGGLASFFYAQLSKVQDYRRNRLQEETKERRELLESLINVRAQVEKSRRNYILLPSDEKGEGYRKTIEALLEARLELSRLMHDEQTLEDLYAGDNDDIQRGMRRMREYLDNDLIKECEENVHETIDAEPNGQIVRTISEPPEFKAFIDDKGWDFRLFFYNYEKAVHKMRQHLLEPNDRHKRGSDRFDNKLDDLFLNNMSCEMFDNLKELKSVQSDKRGSFTEGVGLDRELRHLREFGYIEVKDDCGASAQEIKNLSEWVGITDRGKCLVEEGVRRNLRKQTK